MTDRDYFAAAALIRGMGVLGREQIAKTCYEVADVMLRERERKVDFPAPENAVEVESPCAGHVGTGGTKVGVSAPPAWQEEVASVEEAFERSGVKPTWPADEAGNIGPMAAAMADEIGRLRVAIHSLAERDATLSVQGGSVTVTLDAPLTDAEREAVEFAMEHAQNSGWGTATLRNLLERLK